MRIFVDPGHGGSDSGASFGSYREKDATLGIGLHLCKSLKLKNHIPCLSRTGDYRITLNERARLANKFEADLFISLHTNADADPDQTDDPEAHGSEIWIYPGSKKGLRLATAIATCIPTFFPGNIYLFQFQLLLYSR